jgi:hypothetical protein
MTLLYESEAPNPKEFYIRDPAPEVVTWQGREALRLSGKGACLAILPDLTLSQGRIEVDIGSEGAAYAGIAFRVFDTHNYELAYAQPHTSGKWDAIQYDPVFHGSNTWQLYHGPGAQQVAEVPPLTWFRLRIEFLDQQAIIRVGEGPHPGPLPTVGEGEQPPLFVNPLAHGYQTGLVGLWTYLPAHFSKLRIWDDVPDLSSTPFPAPPEKPSSGTLTEWFLEGFGKVTCEPSGILNLNRYLPVSVGQVRLVRWIEMAKSGDLAFSIGFSDELSLQVDEQVIFTGENLFHSSPNWDERGYVSMAQRVSHPLSQGLHKLTATLKAKEYFGFGMALRIEGSEYKLLPAHLCG